MARVKVPESFEVRPLKGYERPKGRATCGTCGLSWDDDIATSYTPAPSARCPFEAFHVEEAQEASGLDTLTIKVDDEMMFKALLVEHKAAQEALQRALWAQDQASIRHADEDLATASIDIANMIREVC